MKLKTKIYKKVEKQLKSMGFYQIHIDSNTFKPSGYVITDNLEKGYFETQLNNDESKLRITFQFLPIEPIILELNPLKAAFHDLDVSKNNLLSLNIN